MRVLPRRTVNKEAVRSRSVVLRGPGNYIARNCLTLSLFSSSDEPLTGYGGTCL